MEQKLIELAYLSALLNNGKSLEREWIELAYLSVWLNNGKKFGARMNRTHLSIRLTEER